MCVCVRGCVGAWVRMCASVCVEPRTIFGTQRNWQGVPTSFSNPAAFLGVWHRFPTSLCMRCLSGSRGVPTSIFYSLMMMFSTHWGTPQCYSPLKHINAITHYYTYIYIYTLRPPHHLGFASSSCHVVDRVVKLPTVRHVWLRGRSMPSQWPSNGFNGSMLSMGSSSLTWCLPTMGGDAWWRIHKWMYIIFVKGFHQWRYPKIDGLQWKILLKWMIWGYPYFRKSPYIIEIALNIYAQIH